MAIFKGDILESLYALACAEGEGWGTAYEYWAKINLIAGSLKSKKIRTLLVAGLPEKYGYSLDSLALANHFHSDVMVIDERKDVLTTFSTILGRLNGTQLIRIPHVVCRHIDAWQDIKSLPEFDLVFSTGVLQRLPYPQRTSYIDLLLQKTASLFIFIPNGGNKAHEAFTGLRTIGRSELKEYRQRIRSSSENTRIRALDMPPFPPGLYKPAGWKNRNLPGMAFILKLWYYIESVLPEFIKDRFSHMLSLSIQH